MSDYSVIAADGSGSLGVFDNYKSARTLHAKLSKTRSVNLLCMHGCGCIYRAIVKGRHTDLAVGPRHTGWRRSEACPRHRRAPPFEKHGLDDATLERHAAREAAGRR